MIICLIWTTWRVYSHIFSALKLNSLLFKASDVGGTDPDAESSLLMQLPRFTYSMYNLILFEKINNELFLYKKRLSQNNLFVQV